jgi:DNA-binding PadR family transcriptional regulator
MLRTALKPTELHALLALSERPLHGYALVERIAELSGGKLRLLPGNLYVVLHRLTARGLLRETSDPGPSEDGVETRRRVYQLTARGEAALRDELAGLGRLLRSVPARRALAGRGGGDEGR